MIAYRRGDVVLVPFDFTNRAGTRWRPAVIVSSDQYNRSSPDLLIASITGNLRALAHPGDYTLADWKAAGLLRPSLVQTKIATIEASLVGRRLGALTKTDLAGVDTGLRAALELP
jgi:mRNA interferase MazF